MHTEFGHCPRIVLEQILRSSKSSKEMLNAAKYFKCTACTNNARLPQTSKTTLPKPYVFNDTVGVDVFELHDYEGERYSFFNMLCLGTKFQVVGYLGTLKGPPTSEDCLRIFNQAWTTWAGYPKELHADRGVHNRGVFANDLGAHGIAISPIGLQSPEQIGSVERHGDLWKAIVKRVISSKRLVGEEQIRRLTPEITMMKND